MSTYENASGHIPSIVIRNYGVILGYLILSIILIFATLVFHAWDVWDYSLNKAYIYILLAGIFGIAFCVKNFFMYLKGIVINTEKGTISFPAIFRYASVPLSGIERMTSDLKISSDSKGNVSTTYYVIIAGSQIGSHRIYAGSEAKKEHLMAVIARAANLS
ncbi:MAG: hypothetical protein IKO42_01160 [Opitutales bacterium]|nr:hypothetical protein [Opitutales bacterium]